MISLDCSHPDLEDFIDLKSEAGKVTKANISIKVTDEFMNAVINDEEYTLKYYRQETGEEITKVINAQDVFMRFAELNWRQAEPGLLFWDRINDYNLLSEDPDFQYGGVNP